MTVILCISNWEDKILIVKWSILENSYDNCAATPPTVSQNHKVAQEIKLTVVDSACLYLLSHDICLAMEAMTSWELRMSSRIQIAPLERKEEEIPQWKGLQEKEYDSSIWKNHALLFQEFEIINHINLNCKHIQDLKTKVMLATKMKWVTKVCYANQRFSS